MKVGPPCDLFLRAESSPLSMDIRLARGLSVRDIIFAVENSFLTGIRAVQEGSIRGSVFNLCSATLGAGCLSGEHIFESSPSDHTATGSHIQILSASSQARAGMCRASLRNVSVRLAKR